MSAAQCRQKVLGHKSLDTTLRYARAHDQTVADSFYAAMERVDEKLAIESDEEAEEDVPPCAVAHLTRHRPRLFVPCVKV